MEQVRTIDKQRLKDLVCHLDKEIMNKVDEALKVSFELPVPHVILYDQYRTDTALLRAHHRA